MESEIVLLVHPFLLKHSLLRQVNLHYALFLILLPEDTLAIDCSDVIQLIYLSFSHIRR